MQLSERLKEESGNRSAANEQDEDVRRAIGAGLQPSFVFPAGAEIIWLSDRGGLDQPSPRTQP